MTTDDERLRELLGSVRRDEPVPDFDRTWRRAEARARERGGASSALRWVLGPAVAVGAAACAVLLVAALGPGAGDSGEAELALLVDAGVIESPLTGLELPDFPTSSVATAEIEFEEDEDRPGYGLYVGGTDFLLSLDAPAWDQAGERNVL